jgi:4-hydroxy-3-methylbut-2-enyl diphosphate reductase
VTKKLKILLASPRGFCAGVDRAIEIVKKTLEKFGSPVYVRHEIVHNTQVVENLKKLGAVFVEELNEINDRSRPVIFSAHGVPKSVPEEASNKNMFYVDATCPLVTKVHREAEFLYKNGYEVILVGHKDNPEVLGTMGQLPKDSIKLIETARDAENINTNEIKRPAAYVTQTTLSVDDTKEIIEVLKDKFPNIKSPIKEDICYATQNRQDAVKQLALECDLLLVVGSPNSSNSNRLKELAERLGCESYLIDGVDDIDPVWLEDRLRLGITAGASAPEVLVQQVVERLQEISHLEPAEIVSKEREKEQRMAGALQALQQKLNQLASV